MAKSQSFVKAQFHDNLKHERHMHGQLAALLLKL